ncbi:MAG: glycosyltransferase family 4 protein [Armatimonadota bacterium]
MNVTLVAIAQHGGITHYSQCLANALAPHCAVRVIVPEETDLAGYESGVTTVPLPVPMEFSWQEIRRGPQRLAQLPAFLKALEGPPDEVIHFLNRHEYLTLAAPRLRHRLAVTLHDPRPHRGERSPRKLLANWTLRRTAREIFVFGEVLKQHLIEQGVPPQKITVVPHGTFGSFTTTDTTPDDQPTALFFGRILPYKGLEVLLRAAPLIRRRLPEFRLLIAGEGDVSPYGDLLAAEEATGQFELINRFVSDEEMAQLLSRSSLVVLPYLEATQSGVVPLAYGARRPVVATTVGAIPEIVKNGQTGLLVPPGDPVSLADAAVALLADCKLAEIIADAGHRYANENLSWEAIAQTTLSVYQRIRQ